MLIAKLFQLDPAHPNKTVCDPKEKTNHLFEPFILVMYIFCLKDLILRMLLERYESKVVY